MKRLSSVVSVVLALALFTSMLPVSAFAAQSQSAQLNNYLAELDADPITSTPQRTYLEEIRATMTVAFGPIRVSMLLQMETLKSLCLP